MQMYRSEPTRVATTLRISVADLVRPPGKRGSSARYTTAKLAIAALVLWLLFGFASLSAHGADIASIMAGLDTDCVATARQLLSLDVNASRQPDAIQAFIQTAKAAGRVQQWRLSIELLQRALAATAANPPGQAAQALSHTLTLAITSAAFKSGDFELACQYGEAVIQDAQAPASHRAAAYTLVVRSHQSANRLDEACATLLAATQNDQAAVSDELIELAIPLGATCLETKRFELAEQVYGSYQAAAPEKPRIADAKLGQAWAIALSGNAHERAAAQLGDFVAQFPGHADAPHALRAAASCFDQANLPDQAESIRSQLIASYPQSDAALAVLQRYGQAGGEPWPSSVCDAWRQRLNPSTANHAITDSLFTEIFTNAISASDDELWRAAVAALIQQDTLGSVTLSVLTQLVSGNQEPLAEHLAIDLIAGETSSSAACEAACRWAGASERWSMLALAADELGVPNETSNRSIVVDRLLAEALMQSQRPAEALVWWNWLIDHRGVTDFATLVRGAETAVAHGDASLAAVRVEAAEQAAGDDSLNRALTQVLSAELSIRRARFEEARATLQQIIHALEPVNSLRPRAQWLVGETFFMQQQYVEAIDAYRRVDAMDEAGQWAPAALLQAGKSFEKLARGRDAAICYMALLTRFRDWPHASSAQSRLAALQPSTTDDAAAIKRR